MSKHNIVIFLLLLYFHHSVSTSPNANSVAFLKAECGATRYPTLCIHSLSSYSTTSRKHLAQAALSLSLTRAQSASTFISKMATMKSRLKPMEYRAIKDCAANMAGAADQLNRSLKEVGGMNDVESWVGAALTFENTCLDGFRGPTMNGNVKVAITKSVVDCAQVTSIALALFHRYATTRDEAGVTNLP
ncbi:hypothetical protein ACS0TY_014469 [Phlomoides rotata]